MNISELLDSLSFVVGEMRKTAENATNLLDVSSQQQKLKQLQLHINCHANDLHGLIREFKDSQSAEK